MVRVPDPGGVVYSIAPLHDLMHIRQVHRTMLKPTYAPVPSQFGPWDPLSVSIGESEAEEEGDDHGIGILLETPVPNYPTIAQTSLSISDPQVDSSVSGSPLPQEEPCSSGTTTFRRTTRTTAGRHPNPYRLPEFMRSEASGVIISRVLGSSNSTTTGIFRPWD